MEGALRRTSRQAFTGCLKDAKNPQFIAINHKDVPCVAELLKTNGKPTAVPFTILRPLIAGFSGAPYKTPTKKDEKQDPDAKPLSTLVFEKTESGAPKPVMTMYSYKRSGMYDKGLRSEDKWNLEAGSTVLLWLDEVRLKEEAKRRLPAEDKAPKGDPLLPGDIEIIPAFSVCIISIGPKNEETMKKGSAIKVTNVRIATYSLYSLQGDLDLLSSSLGDARTQQLVARDAQPMLAKDLETKDVPFWATVPQVDVPTDVLLKYTNCSRRDWACALLENAIAASAVKILVFTSEFWKTGSGFKAIPVIDAEALLSSGFTVEVEGKKHNVTVEMNPDAQSVEGAAGPTCDDFVLAGLRTELEVAHSVVFNMVEVDTGNVIAGVWKGFFNAGLNGAAAKRKRVTTMED